MPYEYKTSLKSTLSDELINTYLLRPVAGVIVRVLYPTPVTPNQVTIASTIVGIIGAFLYLPNNALLTAIAGLCVTAKDILDSADGQLARAKEQYSRIGRFLDSIGDFIVDVALFGAIGWTLYAATGDWHMPVLAFLGLAGITLRVSYHVFYQSSFLHLEEKYGLNRVTEEVRNEDLAGDPTVLRLQKIFQAIYGWQDRLMVRLDTWCSGGKSDRGFAERWYSDRIALTLSGLVGIGTELFLLMLCSVMNELRLYLHLNLFLMNGIFLLSVFYRRWYLRNALLMKGQS